MHVEVLYQGKRAEFDLLDGENIIGRSTKSGTGPDILIDDPYVSRRHARITFREGRCFIEDLRSANGTQLNGKNLEAYVPASFSIGDELIIEGRKIRLSARLCILTGMRSMAASVTRSAPIWP